jgi:serine/threonine protein kinase
MTDARSRNLTLSAWQRVDGICDEFDRAWRNGGRPRAEEFLQPVDEPARTRLLRELILVEVEYRRRAGENPARSEYAERFPEQLEAIGEVFDNSLSDTALMSDFHVAQEDTVPPTIVMPPEVEGRPSDFAQREGDATSRPTRDDPNVGRVIGMYRLGKRLGGGGMGDVYCATHTAIHSERAIKLVSEKLAQDQQAIQRLFREAQAAITHLSHHNIAKTFDLLRDDDEFYLVMELIRGCDLAQLVRDKGPLPFSEAAQIIEQAATGLAYAHEQGLVHRDIKPQNVMLTTDGTVKILDFGLVGVIENANEIADQASGVSATATSDPLVRLARLTDGQTLLGTLPYMPPEQTRRPHKADARCDLYSLGCTLYFLLTGHTAFTGSTPAEIVSAVRAGKFPRPRAFRPEIPQSLESIVQRSMSTRPENRFASAKQLARALRSARLQEQLEGLQVSGDSLTFETPEELREILLRLRVVREDDWRAAIETVRVFVKESRLEKHKMSESEFVTFLSDTAFYTPDSSDIETIEINRTLEALSFVNRSSGGTRGLSNWQRVYVENGDADLLRLPRHVLLEKIGIGWKGEVFKARNVETNELETVRTFSAAALSGLAGDEPDRLHAFVKESSRIADVQHPVFPKVVSFDTCRNRIIPRMAYLATEFVAGVDVGQFALTHLWHSPDHRAGWAMRLIAFVARGLDVAHWHGLLHLDIQPKCMRFTASGDVKLLDLGIGKMVTPRRLEAAARCLSTQQDPGTVGMVPETEIENVPIMGTPVLMPPEQWIDRANVSPATDIYNLGCVLCYLITGSYPFRGSNVLELMRNIVSKPRVPAEIPAAARSTIETMLAVRPEERFASAGELADALDRVAKSFPSGDTPDSWLRRTWRRLTSA